MTKRTSYISAALLLAASLSLTACSATVPPSDTAGQSPTPIVEQDNITPDGTSDVPSGIPSDIPSDIPSAPPSEVSDGASSTPASEEIIDINLNLDKSDTEVIDTSSLTSTSGVTTITFSGSTANVTGEGVKVKNTKIKIKEAGTYVLTGTYNGSVVVDAKDSDVTLVLDNVSITADDTAAIYVEKANKVIVTLKDGTTNTLTDGQSYSFDTDEETGKVETEPTACLYAKSDLTINGNGTLVVNGNYGQGIKSKDVLKLISGTYKINAVDHGIVGKDMVIIENGTYTITAGADGIKATNDNTNDSGATESGIVVINGGNISISAKDDGISAISLISISSGDINIVTGGGSENATEKHDTFDRGFGWGFNQNSSTQTDTDEESAKGLLCNSQIQITGGNLTIDSQDDAIHSNSSLIIENGTAKLSAGDDGIHADDVLIIKSGTIEIAKSYEGLEALSIAICGGNISINATDDGINAAGSSATGGAMGFNPWGGSSSNASLKISDGNVYVNAYGDGLDSNGSMEISGGIIIVEGPTNGGNAALDTDGEMLINGGTLIALGSTGMFESPSTNSTQNSISIATSITSGTEISLKDSAGKEILAFTPSRTLSSAVVTISTPDIETGKSYTLSTGSKETTVNVSSVVTNEGVSSMGGFGGFGGGNGGFGGNGGGKQPGDFGGRDNRGNKGGNN